MTSTPLDWLFSTQWFGVKLGLDNICRLIREGLANPSPGTKVLHVAGTNGKGSTCALADSVARAHGVRTGLFTSPHLVDFRERIRVDGMMIHQEELDRELIALRSLVATWDPHPTFFELSLAVALRHFKACRCELIILETGMGGRLDATNAVPSDVVVITPIGMDHTEWLGPTLAQIAAEKAGIMKPGVPVISAAQDPEALKVLEESANMTRCPLHIVDQPMLGYPLGLPGAHQRHNAALALDALHALGIPLHTDAVAFGLTNVTWPGRFDHRPANRLVLDGAHNPAGAAVLTATWRDWFPHAQATLIFSALQDKDPASMLAILKPIAARVIVCPVDSPRARDTTTLAAAARHAGFADSDIACHDSLAAALAVAATYPGTTLVTGSLYLIGQTIALLDGSGHQISTQ